MLTLSTPVKFIKRVGDRVAANLAQRGIITVEDLLYHLPFRYEDRLHPKPLSAYRPGDMASLIGEVRGTILLRTRAAPIFEMTVGITPPKADSDESMQGLLQPPSSTLATIGYPEALASGLTGQEKMKGALAPGTPILETVKCLWFHGAYLKDKFRPGQRIALYGKLEASRSGNALNAPRGETRFKMIQPTFEILPDDNASDDDAEFTMLEMGRIVPVYESLGGTTPWGAKLTSRWLRRVLWTVFKDLAETQTAAPGTGQLEHWNTGTLNSKPGTGGKAAPSVVPAGRSFPGGVASVPLHGTGRSAGNSPGAPSGVPAGRSLPGGVASVPLHGTGGSAGNGPGALSVPLHGTGGKGARPTTKALDSTIGYPEALASGLIDHQKKSGALAPGGAALHEDPDDTIPSPLLARLHLPSRRHALQDLHFPPAGTSLDELATARTPAHRRLIFEEFFYLELGLELKRRRLRERAGTAFIADDKVREALKQVLPFKPTAAQKRVLGEIVADMRRPQPMRRLLQGDVGSGKTIVAFQAALIAIENGTQVAMMAPTEILATQHYLAARRLLADKRSPRTGHPYRIALLTGSLDDRTKRDTRARLSRGDIDLAIGTHALVEDSVDFARLGLVIVDEQHRFGVQQRFQLMRKQNASVDLALKGTGFSPSIHVPIHNGASAPEAADVSSPPNPSPGTDRYPDPSTSGLTSSQEKGGATDRYPDPSTSGLTSSQEKRGATNRYPDPSGSGLIAPEKNQGALAPAEPDVLVMTATPIPRTLALTMYGDLEASVLDELPPGRTPIVTRRVSASGNQDRSAEVWDFVRKQVAAGHQAYIVYPIVEGPTTDQPELDFAPAPPTTPGATSSPPHLAARVGTAAADPTTPSAGGALYTSVGRSPTNASSPGDDQVPPRFSVGSHAASGKGRGFSPGEASAVSTTPSAGGALYTSVGRTGAPNGRSVSVGDGSPTKAAKTNKRAGGPTYNSAPNTRARPNLRSATDMHAHLSSGPLAGLKLGLLHGRMSADDKDVTMARFKRGELDVLVATTVIEVGVDVPNATLMVIEHAERFGLSQLHQLRGRVGRGAAKSFCILLTGASVTPDAEQRLDAMVRTQNGFELAELDLQLRGPGEFFGTRQAGLPDLRVASLTRDRDLLELAKTEAARFAASPDPTLTPEQIAAVWSRLKLQWQRRYGLLEA